MASLNIVGGPTAGIRVDLGKEHTVIGRSPDCEVAVPVTSVCRQHARITRRGAGYDALEDAGCHDEEVLGHLRGPEEHVRGCFALDLVLGRE